MKGTYLGEFEEIVLLIVGVQKGEAYGVSVKQHMIDQLNRNITLSAVHTALHRLEGKGFVKSEMGQSSQMRGGKRKRIFTITQAGATALSEARRVREELWNAMPITNPESI